MFCVLTVATTALNFRSYTQRASELEADYQLRSRSAASSCAETALLSIAENRDYAGGESFAFEGDGCVIQPVEASADRARRTIKTTSDVGHAVTKLHVELEMQALRVLSWREE